MLFNIGYCALFGVAVAIPEHWIRQASSSSVSSILSSYSSAVSASSSASVTSGKSATQATSAGTTSTPLGAISTTVLAPSIPNLPPGPNASSYPRDGKLHAPEPAPYTPAGGLDTNGSEPIYVPQSDFDFQSLALVLYQEYIELDLFRSALKRFSVQEFEEAGINTVYRDLIKFMGHQEFGHAKLVSHILGPMAPQRCNYTYSFTSVGGFIDYSQKSTRYGESGALGFISHLNSRPVADLLLQSIATESRQQAIFRQFKGLFPMPFYYVPGIPQSWHWTLLAPSIASCPTNQTRLIWQNFPALNIINNPNSSVSGGVFNTPAISHNQSKPLTSPGREVQLSWEPPGKPVGPDKSYITTSTAGAPKFVAWVSALNITYSPLKVINQTYGTTIQPNGTLGGVPANGTMFIAVTDADAVITPSNISMINPHVVAGPALYQAG